MKLKTIVLILSLGCFYTASFGRAGIAETSFATPGGHTICHCDPYPGNMLPIVVGWDSLARLETWYFYNNNIIGKGDVYWFIFNEENESLQYFTNEIDWENAIDKYDLHPFIYTKWNTMGNTIDGMAMFFAILFFGPILLVSALVILLLFLTKVIIWNKRSKRILAGTILFLVLLIWTQLNQLSF